MSDKTLLDYSNKGCEGEYVGRILNKLYSSWKIGNCILCAYGNPHSKDVINTMVNLKKSNKLKEESKDFIKIAIHFGDENNCIETAYYCFDYVFRFYMPQTCDMIKVFPLNIGFSSLGMSMDEIKDKAFIEEPRSISERDNDIFFIGQAKISNSRDSMFSIKNKLKKLKTLNGDNAKVRIKNTDGFGRGVDIKTYRFLLGSSKICLVPGGLSPETFRYTEAMASGCIVVTDCSTDVYFYKDSPIIKVDAWDENAIKVIQTILLKPVKELDEIGIASRNYYKRVLSPEASANYIIDTIDNKK